MNDAGDSGGDFGSKHKEEECEEKAETAPIVTEGAPTSTDRQEDWNNPKNRQTDARISQDTQATLAVTHVARYEEVDAKADHGQAHHLKFDKKH